MVCRIPILVASLVSLWFMGCTPKAGDSCQKGQAQCVDGQNALVCQAGKFISTPCKGAGACAVKENVMTCDISGNAAGDPCSTDDEGEAACVKDGKSKITCMAGKYVVAPCRGPDGCKTKDKTAMCDMSIAEAGEDCSKITGGSKACSADGKAQLGCKDGKFAVEQRCLGPAGCISAAEGIACDARMGEAGQSDCGPEGFQACSTDKKNLLECKGSKFVVSAACDGDKGCEVKEDPKGPLSRLMDGSTVTCDRKAAEGEAAAPASAE